MSVFIPHLEVEWTWYNGSRPSPSFRLLQGQPVEVRSDSSKIPFDVSIFSEHELKNFQITSGVTPMASLPEACTALVLYYSMILFGTRFMKSRAAMKLDKLFQAHNLVLAVVSAMLLLLVVEQLVPTLARQGFFYAVCRYDGGWTKELIVLYYLNYLTKYLEWADTLFLVLQKKRLTFLRTYHHGATAFLCYAQLKDRNPAQWVPITLNLAVHVPMYWYYFQKSRGARVRWKKCITMAQIVQFVIDVAVGGWTTYTCVVSKYLQGWQSWGPCDGGLLSHATATAILGSYLGLFLAFYRSTYRRHVKTYPWYDGVH